MKLYFAVATLLSFTIPALGETIPEHLSLSARFKIAEGVSAVVSMPEQSAIGIIGPIDSNTLAAYRATQLKFVTKVLFIDSGGGDVSSAMAIADDLRKHNIRLVVAGKCFSACANYIFTGTGRKDVLPGSLIGIHSTKLDYYADNKITRLSLRDHEKISRLDKYGNLKKQMLEISKKEQDFFSKIGLSTRNFKIFDDYQLRLEKSNGKKYFGCRKIDMWILSKNELQDMGVSGMRVVWMPNTTQEVAVLSKELGLNPADVFFGSSQQLSGACEKS